MLQRNLGCVNRWYYIRLINTILHVCLIASMLKHSRTPSTANPSIEYPSGDSDHLSKRPRPVGLSEEVLAISLFSKTCHHYWILSVGT